jgi:hypothetical protein
MAPAFEMIVVRLTRMQALIESLEAACAQSPEQREILQVLTRELDESRRLIQSLK